jgi:hypothetical protein
MKRIVRLTERDLSRIVKRVIREQEEDSMDTEMYSNDMEEDLSPEEMAADKVEDMVDSPRFERGIERILDNLDDRDIMMIQRDLRKMGITPNTSVEEIHQIVQSEMEDSFAEMTEQEEMNDKQKIANFLEGIGQGNLAAWGGIPLAIAIGGAVGSFGIGLAASWGATGLLYGIAKLLSEKK